MTGGGGGRAAGAVPGRDGGGGAGLRDAPGGPGRVERVAVERSLPGLQLSERALIAGQIRPQLLVDQLRLRHLQLDLYKRADKLLLLLRYRRLLET